MGEERWLQCVPSTYYAVRECSAKEVRGCSRELFRDLEGMLSLHAMIRSSPRQSWRRLKWRNHGCELVRAGYAEQLIEEVESRDMSA